MKRVKETWLAVMVFALTLALLCWLLNPRPFKIVHYPNVTLGRSATITVSPDESQLVIADGNLLQLINLHSQQHVVKVPHTNDQYGFDAQGRFVYLGLQKDTIGLEEGIQLTLWRFDTKTEQSIKLMTRRHRLVYENGPNTSFKGLHRLGLYREHALLSPDCTTLLVSSYSSTMATFELIDVETGSTRASLELPPMQLNACYSLLVEAEFSLNGQTLLIQTEDRAGENTHYRLRLFNANSGKQLCTMQLPGEESLGSGRDSTEGNHFHGFDRDSSIWHNQSRLGSALHFDNDCIICNLISDFNDKPNGITFIDFSTQSVKNLDLDELHLSPHEEIQSGKTEGKELRSNTSCYLCKSKNAVFSMAQYQESVPADWREGDRFLPIWSFSTRSVKDGRLLRTSRYAEAASLSESDLQPEMFLARHQDGNAVFKTNVDKNVPKPKFMEWIDKVRSWMNMPTLRTYYIINTSTGISENTFSYPVDVISVHWLSSGKVLALIGKSKDNLVILKYDYPLHKPWFLIICWAIGLATITFIYCESIKAFKSWRMKPNHKSGSLSMVIV